MNHPQQIVPREKLDFGLDGDIPKYWFGGDAFKSRFFDAMSTIFPEGERYFISCVRDYRDQVTDPKLLQDIKDFMRQEGQHGLADTSGEGLDETHRLPLDHGDDRPGDLGVVDGVLDRIGDGGDRGTALAQVEGDIGGEALALGAFEGEDAVVPAGGQARQPDLIGRGGGHRCSFQQGGGVDNQTLPEMRR